VKLKRLSISSEFFRFILSGDKVSFWVTRDPLPKDAQLIGISHDPQTNQVSILFFSNEFEDIPEGDVIPKLMPLMTTFTGPA
jgi:hypothetical protein